MGMYGHLPILPFILAQWIRGSAEDPLTLLSTLKWALKYDNQPRGPLPQLFLYYLFDQEQT